MDLQSLDEALPDVSIEDQVPLGLSWEDNTQRRGDRKAFWESLKGLMENLNGPASTVPKEETIKGTSQETADQESTTGSAANDSESHQAEEDETGDGEELEEWEIEAEKHFQGSEDVAPAPAVVASKTKKKADNSFNRQQLNFIMEQAVIQPLSFDQEQVCLVGCICSVLNGKIRNVVFMTQPFFASLCPYHSSCWLSSLAMQPRSIFHYRLMKPSQALSTITL